METIGNWWTRPLWCETTGEEEELPALERCLRRVRYHLSEYGSFERHYYGGTAAYAEGGLQSAKGLTSGAGWEDDICIKADLDRALRLITRRQRQAIVLCYIGGYGQREAGEKMGVRQQVVYKHLQVGVKSIATILAG